MYGGLEYVWGSEVLFLRMYAHWDLTESYKNQTKKKPREVNVRSRDFLLHPPPVCPWTIRAMGVNGVAGVC